MSQVKVYLVGAGPGDAELITLKGLRLLSEADVILYDHLIAAGLLDLAKPQAELVSVGKSAGRHTMGQEEINRLLIEKAQTAGNRVVVRLKGGDPYLFGRGGEEAEACARAGVDFEVVPGVSSALAAPCYAGIPVTHRDYTSNVAIITGHRRDEQEIEIPNAGTVVFLMSVTNLPKIICSLRNAGWPPETAMAAVERGTCYNQRVLTGTLGGFQEVAERAGIRPPTVFIVGKVAELQQQLDWFGRRPRIFLPGTHPGKYRHLGTIIHRPLIRSIGLEDHTDTDAVLRDLSCFDWIVFSSTNGVKFFFERLNAIGLDTRALRAAKVAAIGATTAAALGAVGVLADMQPELESSVGLLSEFQKLAIEDRRILLVRPRSGPSDLADGLTKAGASVETVVTYRNVEIEPEETDFDFVDQILFTSGSTVRAFLKRYGSVPGHIKVNCLGQSTLNEARKHGLAAELLQG